MQTADMSHPLASALNRLLALDPETRALLSVYAGSTIAIELQNTRETIRVRIIPEGIAIGGDAGTRADVTVRGTPGQLFAYLMAMRRDEPAGSGLIGITGNIALAQKLAGILRQLDPDWEDLLAGRIGDGMARYTGNIFRKSLQFAAHVRDTLQTDTGEYLRHESGLVPDRTEVERFIGEVDALRDDVERLRARIDRLQQRSGKDG